MLSRAHEKPGHLPVNCISQRALSSLCLFNWPIITYDTILALHQLQLRYPVVLLLFILLLNLIIYRSICIYIFLDTEFIRIMHLSGEYIYLLSMIVRTLASLLGQNASSLQCHATRTLIDLDLLANKY